MEYVVTYLDSDGNQHQAHVTPLDEYARMTVEQQLVVSLGSGPIKVISVAVATFSVPVAPA